MRYLIAVPRAGTFDRAQADAWYAYVRAAITSFDEDAEVVEIGTVVREPNFTETLATYDRAVIDMSGDNTGVWLLLGGMRALKRPIVTTRVRTSDNVGWSEVPLVSYDEEDLGSDSAAAELGRTLQSLFTVGATDRTARKVFISYSHADTKYLKRLLVHLRPLEVSDRISAWSDTQLRAGDEWQSRIEKEIERCDVAILLISADFLASSFIVRNELPPILTAAEGRGLRVMSLILKPCRFARTPELARFHAVNPPSEPLISASEARQEEVFDSLADQIERTLS